MEQVHSITRIFEEVAARHPDMPAVRSAAQSFTYAELNRAANRIARAVLTERGDGEEPVALLFGKNAMVAAAMLGAIKAGKFYVPLDASDPLSRTALILADSGAPLVLTDSANLPTARTLGVRGNIVLNVDEFAHPYAAACPDDHNLDLIVPATRLVYLLYTSGSTGAPKGIPHPHASVVRAMASRAATGFIYSTERRCLLSSLSTASSVSVLFSQLLDGGTTCIYNLQEEGVAGLAAWLRREGITTYQSTPTVFRHFCATLRGVADLPALRHVYLNGEAVLAHDVGLFQTHFAPPCRLRTSYGSSEARAISSWLADHQTRLTSARAPVGFLRPHVSVFIWDEAGNPVQPGTLGEIVVQSDMLTPGYWHDPVLTAQRFLPDPEGGSRRLFKTGDLGILRADGMLEYHGRMDDQVKVRGHRVEPEEIEAALLAVPGVSQAAVVPHAGANGDTRLIAYLTTANRTRPPAASLRARLAQSLPDYMLPSDFMVLDAFPLNASGKVDRRALPLPSGAPAAPTGIALQRDDRTAVEVLAIWREVFGVPLSADDDFFALGGHSLIAGRIVAEIDQRLGIKLAPAALVEAPTAALLAAHIRMQSGPSGP